MCVAIGPGGPNYGCSPAWHCMSLLSLFGLSGLLHFYIGLRLIPALPGAWAGGVLALLLVASAALMPLGMVARRLLRPPQDCFLAPTTRRTSSLRALSRSFRSEWSNTPWCERRG